MISDKLFVQVTIKLAMQVLKNFHKALNGYMYMYRGLYFLIYII